MYFALQNKFKDKNQESKKHPASGYTSFFVWIYCIKSHPAIGRGFSAYIQAITIISKVSFDSDDGEYLSV